jgi:hypothetical protein
MATVGFGDFEWDEDKARSSLEKHGVAFEEASSVFLDPHFLATDEPTATDRFIAVGFLRVIGRAQLALGRGMTCWRLGLTAALVAGCGNVQHTSADSGGKTGTSAGDGGTTTDGGAGGAAATRLVPWQLEAEGTEPLVRGIYDTREQMACSFVPDSAGHLRCLPLVLPSLVFSAGFTDTACTRPAMLVDPTISQASSSVPVTRGWLPPTNCTPERFEVQTVTVFPEGTRLYVQDLDGACSQQPEPPTYEDGSPARVALLDDTTVPPERYVAGTLVDGPLLGTRVKLVRIATEDGAAFDHQLTDQHWDLPCQLSDAGDCAVSYLLHDTTSFADVGCTTPVWSLAPCAPKTFIAGPTGVDEGDHAVGDAFAGVVFHNLKGCYATPPGREHWYVEGPALMASEAVARVTWSNVGTGRLQLRALRGDEAYVLADYLAAGARYHDTVTNEDCNPVDAPDGRVYCVTASAVEVLLNPLQGLFADAQCTKPAFQCTSPSCDEGLGIVVAAQADGTKRATSLAQITKLSEVYLSGANGSCSVTPGMFFFGVGDQVPWDNFPEIPARNAR